MATTLGALDRSAPVLIGRLSIDRTGDDLRPVLIRLFWDPFGRRFTRVSLPASVRPDSVIDYRTTDLDGEPVVLAVTPNPSMAKEYQALSDGYNRLYRACRTKTRAGGERS